MREVGREAGADVESIGDARTHRNHVVDLAEILLCLRVLVCLLLFELLFFGDLGIQQHRRLPSREDTAVQKHAA